MVPVRQDGWEVRRPQTGKILASPPSSLSYQGLLVAVDVSPPVPVNDLFGLVDFSLVRWDLVNHVIPTWLGMVLVVAFASSLDVAAISMDMGEALDTNKELTTVGIGNLLSGLTLGYTGSEFSLRVSRCNSIRECC